MTTARINACNYNTVHLPSSLNPQIKMGGQEAVCLDCCSRSPRNSIYSAGLTLCHRPSSRAVGFVSHTARQLPEDNFHCRLQCTVSAASEFLGCYWDPGNRADRWKPRSPLCGLGWEASPSPSCLSCPHFPTANFLAYF